MTRMCYDSYLHSSQDLFLQAVTNNRIAQQEGRARKADPAMCQSFSVVLQQRSSFTLQLQKKKNVSSYPRDEPVQFTILPIFSVILMFSYNPPSTRTLS